VPPSLLRLLGRGLRLLPTRQHRSKHPLAASLGLGLGLACLPLLPQAQRAVRQQQQHLLLLPLP
jgi:hypothetical protein